MSDLAIELVDVCRRYVVGGPRRLDLTPVRRHDDVGRYCCGMWASWAARSQCAGFCLRSNQGVPAASQLARLRSIPTCVASSYPNSVPQQGQISKLAVRPSSPHGGSSCSSPQTRHQPGPFQCAVTIQRPATNSSPGSRDLVIAETVVTPAGFRVVVLAGETQQAVSFRVRRGDRGAPQACDRCRNIDPPLRPCVRTLTDGERFSWSSGRLPGGAACRTRRDPANCAADPILAWSGRDAIFPGRCQT